MLNQSVKLTYLKANDEKFQINPRVFEYSITILKCPSACDALNLFSKQFLNTKSRNVSTITFEINEEKLTIEEEKLPEVNNEDRIFLSLESILDEYQKNFLLKSKKMKNFVVLNMSEGSSLDLKDFVKETLIESLTMEKFGFNINFASLESSICNFLDINGFNLLTRSIYFNKFKVFEELLNFPFDINRKDVKGNTAADIAWEKKNYEVLLKLLNSNSVFPKDFNESEGIEEIKDFIKISKNLHDFIIEDKFEEVKKFFSQNHNLRYFYNSKNVSATAIALINKKYEIYKFLTEHNCSIGQHEDLKSFEIYDFHLIRLISRTFVNSSVELKTIFSIYEFLNSLPEINLIMKLVAVSNVQILVNFHETCSSCFKPVYGVEKCNTYKRDGEILLNIKSKVDSKASNNKDKNLISQICHEFYRLAINFSFDNNDKPYGKVDKENEEKFSRIITECQKFTFEETFKAISELDENVCASELIVRVPQIIAFYQNDKKKLEKIKSTFKSLFDYYDNVVLPKMEETLSILSKIENEAKFSDLTESMKEKILNSFVIFQGKKIKLSQIVEDSEILEFLQPQEIRKLLDEKCCLKIGQYQSKSRFYIERKLNEVKENSKIGQTMSLAIPQKKFQKLSLYYDNVFDSDRINEIASKISKLFLQNFMGRLKVLPETSKVENSKLESLFTLKEIFKFSNFIILADHLGSGKTEFLMNSISLLKKEFTNSWISYIDLKNHLKVYEKFLNLDCVQILLEILNISDAFEREIFKNCFQRGKVILLFDSFDEIPKSFQEVFIKFIENVQFESKNKICIAMRPQNAQKLNGKVFRFLPFDKNEIKEIIENYLESQVSKIRLKIDTSYTDYLFKSTSEIFDNFKDISNPLFLKLIVENFVDQGNVNLYKLYQNLALKENFNDERTQDLSLWQVHQIYALKSLFYDSGEKILPLNLNELSIIKKWNSKKESFDSESISSHGFLFIDDWNNSYEYPVFAHRTFAEYFVANFLVENIFNIEEKILEEELNLRLKIFICVCDDENVFRFIEDYLIFEEMKLSENLKKGILKFFSNKNIENFFMKFLETFLKTEKKVQSLPKLFLNLLRVFKNVEEIIQEFFEIGENETLLNYFIANCSEFEAILDAIEQIEKVYGENLFKLIPNSEQEKLKENFLILNHSYEENEKINQDNLLRLFKLSSSNLSEKILSAHLAKILNFSFRSFELIDEIFENLYHFESKEACEMFKIALLATHFHNYSLYYEFPTEFINNYEHFWNKLEKYFDESSDLMRKILLQNFKDHLLILALRYNMTKVIEIYLKYCNVKEIQNILMQNSESLAEHLEEIKNIEKISFIENFFKEIFINSPEELRKFLKTEFSPEKLTILSYLRQAEIDYNRRNENDCEKIVSKLFDIFNNLRENLSLKFDCKTNYCIKQFQKRALGKKYFNQPTVLPLKHEKRAVNLYKSSEYIEVP